MLNLEGSPKRCYLSPWHIRGTGCPESLPTLEILKGPPNDRPVKTVQKTICLSTRYSLSTWSMSSSQAGPWGIQTGSYLDSLGPQGQNLRGTYWAVVERGTTFSQSPMGILISHNQTWPSLREKLQMVIPQFPRRTLYGCQSRARPPPPGNHQRDPHTQFHNGVPFLFCPPYYFISSMRVETWSCSFSTFSF